MFHGSLCAQMPDSIEIRLRENVAYLSELTGDVKNARKYYQMVKDSNDPEFAPIAISALDALRIWKHSQY